MTTSVCQVEMAWYIFTGTVRCSISGQRDTDTIISGHWEFGTSNIVCKTFVKRFYVRLCFSSNCAFDPTHRNFRSDMIYPSYGFSQEEGFYISAMYFSSYVTIFYFLIVLGKVHLKWVMYLPWIFGCALASSLYFLHYWNMLLYYGEFQLKSNL